MINGKKNNTAKSQQLNICRINKETIKGVIDGMYYDKYVKPFDVREHEYIWTVR